MQRNLRGIIEKLPKTLDETYERILKDIDEDNMEHARRLLHCIAVAIRPLRVEELAEILAFDFDDTQWGIPKFRPDWRWKDQEEEAVLYTCSSLITVVDSRLHHFGKCRVVQFSHFSVKEFLISDRLASSTRDVSRYHILPGPAHTILAQACLGFLLHLDIPTDEEISKRLPLARYAAQHWVAHAQFEDVESHLKDGIQSLFDPDKHHLVAWVGVYNIDRRSDFTPSPLYYAALCGFYDLVEHLVISHPQLINAVGGHYDFPVLAALSGKHVQVAEFLLQHGGKVDIRGTDGRTLLQTLYSCAGDDIVSMASFLLKHGADVNFRGSDLSTSLHHATMWANFEVAQFLLESGADIDSRDDKGQTPLHMIIMLAEEEEARDVTQLLLEHGANVNAQDKDGATPLLLAAYRGYLCVTHILLEHGAEPNAKNNDCETSLHLLIVDLWPPSSNSHRYNLARLLLKHGANVNEPRKDNTTPLHLAIKSRSYEMAQILLDHGAEPNVATKIGETPLHLALQRRYYPPESEIFISSLVRLLLERGADVNAQDKYNITPLLLAIKGKMYEIARILLSRGAEPKVKNNGGKTPLHLLSENNSDDDFPLPVRPLSENDFSNDDDILGLARLLLDRGADVNARDQNNVTPLLLAAGRHMDDIARILLERGADPSVKNTRGKTPLHLLLERNFDDYNDVDGVLVVERLLLERGADVNAQDNDNITPLYLACHHRRFDIAQLILDYANVETDNRTNQLHVTLKGEYNSQNIVQRLTISIDRAEQTITQNMDLTTHLHSACYLGKLERAREALGHGAGSNAENIRGETPLHLVSRGQYDSQDQEGGVGIVHLLLGRGANINAQDNGHMTPLHLACYYGKLEIVRALLSHDASVNTKGELGQTTLHLVLDGNRCGRDTLGIVRLLLENGADVNAQDSNNETPLHLACNYGKLGIGRVLLIHGANANAANICGQTPLHLLSMRPYVKDECPGLFVGILVNGGADVNARNNDNETPSQTACRNDRFDIVDRLFNKRADN